MNASGCTGRSRPDRWGIESVTNISPLTAGSGAGNMAPIVPMHESALSLWRLPWMALKQPYRSTSRSAKAARFPASRPGPSGARLRTSSFVRTTSDGGCESNLQSFGAGSRQMGLRRQRPKADPFTARRAADPRLPFGSRLLDTWRHVDPASLWSPRRSTARVHRAVDRARACGRERARAR